MVGFDTYHEAAAHLPVDAKWSSSFGYPRAGGHRYTIQNGHWGDAWTIAMVVER
jgi:hypothetical protein